MIQFAHQVEVVSGLRTSVSKTTAPVPVGAMQIICISSVANPEASQRWQANDALELDLAQDARCLTCRILPEIRHPPGGVRRCRIMTTRAAQNLVLLSCRRRASVWRRCVLPSQSIRLSKDSLQLRVSLDKPDRANALSEVVGDIGRSNCSDVGDPWTSPGIAQSRASSASAAMNPNAFH
jgi:hypothetical protein